MHDYRNKQHDRDNRGTGTLLYSDRRHLPSPHLTSAATLPPTQTLVPRFPNPIPMSDRLRNPVLRVQDSCAPWLQIAVGVASKLHPTPASGAGQEYQEYQGARRLGCSGRWGIMEGGRSTLLGVDLYERGRRFLGGHKRELCWRNLDSEIYIHASSVRDLIKALLASLLIEAL